MAFSTRTMQPADWAGLRHFRPGDFKAPERMGYEFVRWLDDLRATLGWPLLVSSDYRSPERNAAAGGAFASAHMDTPCDAVDLSARCFPTSARRLELVIAAITLGCRRIGIYENGSVHLDRTEDRRPRGLWTKV